jgi:hypothetical protein
MGKKKYLLVTHTNVDGEREYNGQTVLVLSPRVKEENAVHKYFMDFWGVRSKEFEKCTSYTYLGGEVMVKRINWKEITESQYNVLQELKLS